MKFVVMPILMFFSASLAYGVETAPVAPQEETPVPSVAQPGKRSTDMSFDELLVQGKFHFTDEAVTTVEDDKVLDGLLEVRKDFKDRIEQSAARF